VRELLITGGTLAGALILVAAAVFGANDAGLFVPPPEALAEDFARALGKGRYDVAHRYMSSETRAHETAGGLRAGFETARARLGAFEDVRASALHSETDHASAVAEIRGSRANTRLTVVLKREHGLWTVQHWEAAGETPR
jgi:hypothetical protein